MFAVSDDDVTDAFQGVLTGKQVDVVRAAVRLRREGARHVTDRLVRANSGACHSTFFEAKKLLVQLGLYCLGWRILMPEDWAEKARAARKAVLQGLLEKCRAWRLKQRLWVASLRQPELCTISGPIEKLALERGQKANVRWLAEDAHKAVFVEKYGLERFREVFGG